MRFKILAAFIALILASAFAEAQQPLEKALDFRSGVFRCTVLPDGRLKDIYFRGQLVVKDISLCGKDESSPQRMIQGEALSVAKTSVQINNDGCLTRTEGFLARGQKEPRAVRYVQATKIGPSCLELDCEVETLVPMSARMQFLSTNVALPLEAYIGRGYLLERPGRASELWMVPFAYAKESDIHAFAKKAAFSLKGFVVEFSSPETLSIGDERSWKGKDLMIAAQRDLGWSHTPITYKAGSKFRWSLKISLMPNDA